MSTDRPLRILHLSLATDAGGLSRYIIDLSNAMAAQGHEIIVAADRGEWQARFENQKFKFIQIPLKSELWLFRKCIKTLCRELRDAPMDVVHTHYRRATMLARGFQRNHPFTGIASASRKGPPHPPILYTLHLSHISLSFPRNLFTDFGDHTHIASEDARDWVIQRGKQKPNRVTYIPHGVDTNRFKPVDPAAKRQARAALQLEDDDVVAAFVGRLDAPKNEDWLLDLAAASKAQLPKLRVVLAGDGPHMAMLRDRIDSENLHDRVRLLGEVDPLPLYHAADALLLPSAREGFSLVCAEAMACGVPALRTRTSGTSELIIENTTGRSTPIEKDAFIAAAMQFLSDRDRLDRMGAAAQDHVRSRFVFDQQVAATVQLYRSLSSG
jgi:glycosyltransferase involved in cell wall biosynthesis